MDTCDRFLGCMLGGATGDALGYIIEFDDWYTIRKKFGPYGLRTILRLDANGRKGIISDDTQMSLFTADGLLWAAHDALPPEEGLYRSYMRWYYTQTKQVVQPDQSAWMTRQAHEKEWDYDMIGEEDLYARRAPGKTCLSALAGSGRSDNLFADNDSKGCGSIMRAAPVGLFYAGDPEKAFDVGCQSGRLTHGNPTGYLAAGMLSASVSLLSQGNELADTLPEVMRILQKHEHYEGVKRAVMRAVDEAVTDREAWRAMKRIGKGWVAEETYALAIYCLLKTGTLKDAVIMACNQDGDSDSCGAVCGNMAGAMYGADAVPRSWSHKLECSSLVTSLAQSLFKVHEDGKEKRN